jgi:hypothetical protein
MISSFLKDIENCEAPCFLGILPGRTTLGEAKDIITHLGFQLKCFTYQGPDVTYQGQEFCESHYVFDNGLSVLGSLLVQNEVIWNLWVGITPENPKVISPREWLAFSPGTLIRRYGSPSSVSFALDWGPRSFIDMIMFFDTEDLIVEYSSYDLIPRQKGSPVVCPITARFDTVRLWMGKDPVYPPAEGVLLEKATSMTIEEFSELMTGNPDKACFKLNREMFP